jgi:hypothetical protein
MEQRVGALALFLIVHVINISSTPFSWSLGAPQDRWLSELRRGGSTTLVYSQKRDDRVGDPRRLKATLFGNSLPGSESGHPSRPYMVAFEKLSERRILGGHESVVP